MAQVCFQVTDSVGAMGSACFELDQCDVPMTWMGLLGSVNCSAGQYADAAQNVITIGGGTGQYASVSVVEGIAPPWMSFTLDGSNIEASGLIESCPIFIVGELGDVECGAGAYGTAPNTNVVLSVEGASDVATVEVVDGQIPSWMTITIDGTSLVMGGIVESCGECEGDGVRVTEEGSSRVTEDGDCREIEVLCEVEEDSRVTEEGGSRVTEEGGCRIVDCLVPSAWQVKYNADLETYAIYVNGVAVDDTNRGDLLPWNHLIITEGVEGDYRDGVIDGETGTNIHIRLRWGDFDPEEVGDYLFWLDEGFDEGPHPTPPLEQWACLNGFKSYGEGGYEDPVGRVNCCIPPCGGGPLDRTTHSGEGRTTHDGQCRTIHNGGSEPESDSMLIGVSWHGQFPPTPQQRWIMLPAGSYVIGQHHGDAGIDWEIRQGSPDGTQIRSGTESDDYTLFTINEGGVYWVVARVYGTPRPFELRIDYEQLD